MFSPSCHSTKQQTKAKHGPTELKTTCECENGEFLSNYEVHNNHKDL